jgi:hypothetical protein
VSTGAQEDPLRLVCYCFDHRVVDIEQDVLAHGRSTIAIAVLEACRAGLARCAERNPAGTCCLGRLRAIARIAAATPAPDCCNRSGDDR